jgi:hypothetical protein
VTGPQARKGHNFERAVVEVFRMHGHDFAERAYGAGRPDDTGDLDGILGGRVVVECKNANRLELGPWSDEAEAERIAARADFGLLVVKRRLKSAGQAFAVLPLGQAARLLKELDDQ